MNRKSPRILILGTADTKEVELSWMCDRIRTLNGTPIIMDVSVLGDTDLKVDYTKHDVAAAAGTDNQSIASLGDENLAMTKTSEGATNLCAQLCAKRKVDGVIIIGGTMGTDLALTVCLAIPLGIPKVILSTVAFSHLIPPDRLSPDLIMMLWSGGLYGLNSICCSILSQACGAVVGAALASDEFKEPKNMIALSSLGKSALTYMVTLKPLLDEKGFETIVFHTTGPGGRALEKLASDKKVLFVLDLCLAEVANESRNSIVTSGGNRLESAGLSSIPQIVAPGGLGLVDVATWQKLPDELSGRIYHAHNQLLASYTMSPDEMRELAKIIMAKLAKAKAPVKFILPLHGFIEWDREGMELHNPENVEAFCSEIRRSVRSPVELIELDCHICDDSFCQEVLKQVDNWIKSGIIKNIHT